MSQVLPFAVVLIFAMLALGLTSSSSITIAMERNLTQKSRTLTQMLAVTLSDTMEHSDYKSLQRFLNMTKTTDPDITYAVVESTDGKALATTEENMKDKVLNSSDTEKLALAAKTYMVHRTDANSFESVAPILVGDKPVGILRMGMSFQRANQAAQALMLTMLLIGTVSVLVGIWVCASLTKAPSATPVAAPQETA